MHSFSESDTTHSDAFTHTVGDRATTCRDATDDRDSLEIYCDSLIDGEDRHGQGGTVPTAETETDTDRAGCISSRRGG